MRKYLFVTILFLVCVALALVNALVPALANTLYAANRVEKLYLIKDDFEDSDKVLVFRTATLYYAEPWVIEYGIGCLSMWRFEDKMILASYSTFLDGIGGKLYLPGRNQSCRIWDAEPFEDTYDDLRDEDIDWLYENGYLNN